MKHVRLVTTPIHALYVQAPVLDRFLLMALPMCEVLHLPIFIFYVNVGLITSGAIAIHYETRCKRREEAEMRKAWQEFEKSGLRNMETNHG